MIYVAAGRTNPKLVLDGTDFRLQEKHDNSTIWRCSYYYRTKCKCRLRTAGNVVQVTNNHNHESAKINLANLITKNVLIVRKNAANPSLLYGKEIK